MVQFPVLVPPTVDHSDDWLIVHGDENHLAQEEAELEAKVLCYAFVSHGQRAIRSLSAHAPAPRRCRSSVLRNHGGRKEQAHLQGEEGRQEENLCTTFFLGFL